MDPVDCMDTSAGGDSSSVPSFDASRLSSEYFDWLEALLEPSLKDDDSSSSSPHSSSSIEDLHITKRKPPQKPYARKKTIYDSDSSSDDDDNQKRSPLLPKNVAKQKKHRDSLLDDDSDSSYEKLLEGQKIKNDDNDEEAIELTDPWSSTAIKKTASNDGSGDKPFAVAAATLRNNDDHLLLNDADVSSSESSKTDTNTTGDVQDVSAWKFDKQRNEYTFQGGGEFPEFWIPAKLYESLYDHQRSGVQFLASLHQKGIGGVLGDDMGMVSDYSLVRASCFVFSVF